jgi:mRNA interferase RelE/StbE
MKDLRRIAPVDVPRIVAVAEALAEDPYPAGCTKLSGSERSCRIRAGDYRILYELFSGRLLIEVVQVGHRKDVYRRSWRTSRFTFGRLEVPAHG